MNLSEQLTAKGFKPGDQKKDFGGEIPYTKYFYRTRVIHEYVSLVHSGDKFVEGVYETYKAPKAPNDKTNKANKLDAAIFRDAEKFIHNLQ